MEFTWDEEGINIGEKELNPLDQLTIDFCTVLDGQGVRHVVISGYTAILFGRSRNSEDIDLFIEPLTKERFSALWKAVTSEFVCLNTDNEEEAFEEYYLQETGLRFSRPGVFVPNIEIKMPVGALELHALQARIRVVVNDEHVLFIGPLEQQIAYKLYLGSDKDLEDAKHLHLVFRGFIKENVLHHFVTRLSVADKMRLLR